MAAAGRILKAGSACALAALVLASQSSAEIRDVTLKGGKLQIEAGDSADAVEVTADRNGVLISHRDGVPSAGPPCEGGYPESSELVTCPRRKVDVVVVELGDGDDSFKGRGDLRFVVDGDMGNDVVKGGDANDDLFGGVGDDKLVGKGGKDRLDGGPGKDQGDGGEGKDRCEGVEKGKC